MTQCGLCVGRLYKNVIDEVIAGAREHFLDEGVDEQVLNDLKQQWDSKLSLTKAAEHSELSLPPLTMPAPPPAPVVQPPTVALVPVQITVPSQHSGGVSKTITIHVPSTALSSGLAGVQLQNILGSPAAAQTFALEPTQAAEIIQRQLNTALMQNGVSLPPRLMNFSQTVTQVDGPADQPLEATMSAQAAPSYELKAPCDVMDNILCEHLRKTQTDGAIGLGDSSDEISDDDDDDEEDDKDKDLKDDEDEVEEEEEEDASMVDDPLNSEDDVSDEPGEIFDTENVVVCQYDKITRVRNKWRFHLKDGIMHLKNKDYVFTKANGEGEW